MSTRSKYLLAALAMALSIGPIAAASAAPAAHVQDNRATKALNLLENQGYGIPLGTRDPLGSYAQFQTEGHHFAVYAVRHGVAERLRIDPETGLITPDTLAN